MPDEVVQSTVRAAQVLEILFEDGFHGKTINEIILATDMTGSAVRRALLSWKSRGWVVEVPVAGSKATCWRVSSKLVGIAHAYERYAMERIHQIKTDYLKTTGRELNA